MAYVAWYMGLPSPTDGGGGVFRGISLFHFNLGSIGGNWFVLFPSSQLHWFLLNIFMNICIRNMLSKYCPYVKLGF